MNRQKRKLEKDISLEDLLVGWTQCCFLVPRKQKLCNVARTGDTLYCGNHQPQDSTIDTDKAEDKQKERIPCPIDGTHTIYRYNLKQHIKVCTKQKQNNAMSALPYFKQDCNSGLPLPAFASMASAEKTAAAAAAAELINPEQLAKKVNACFERILAQHGHSNSSQGNMQFLESPLPPAVDAVHDALTGTISAQLGQDLTAQSRLRHVDQDILIAEQMLAHDLLHFTAATAPAATHPGVCASALAAADTPRNYENVTSSTGTAAPKAVYVELGAGRGLLSHAVSCADPSATVVLVERSGSRKKVDKALKDTFAAMDSAVVDQERAGTAAVGAVHRARMDIRHCYVPNLPGVSALESVPAGVRQPVVVIAKHLCGVATDLAIHSLRAFPHLPGTCAPATVASTGSAGSAGSAGDRCAPAGAHRVGLSIATCCHHACHFPDYTGREWYLSQGFTEAEFDVLRKWSGWANSGTSHRGDSTVEEDGGEVRDEETPVSGARKSAATAPGTTNAPTSVIRPTNITPDEMKAIGWKVKRIIDQGRVEFLRGGFGLAARQLKYCANELSPECVMIVAAEH
jgi:tRNA:m4X modification enzyme